MSFNKRHITKEKVLNNILDLDALFGSDCIIMDTWSSKFYNNLDSNDRDSRRKIISEFSGGCPDKHPDWNRLKSISESLISISKNPNWVDIHFIQEKCGKLDLEEGDMGVLESVSKKAILSAINYFER